MGSGTSNTTELILGDLRVLVADGQLRSLQRGGHEYMHQPSEPGWGHSDTEMFPIIGPTAGAGYRVQVPRGNAVQDQHGLLRELDYATERVSATEAVCEKRYEAGTPVANSKYPDRSGARFLMWPYAFGFRKRFVLDPGVLRLHFDIDGERDMPYMLGYHPAFRITGAGLLCASELPGGLAQVLI